MSKRSEILYQNKCNPRQLEFRRNGIVYPVFEIPFWGWQKDEQEAVDYARFVAKACDNHDRLVEALRLLCNDAERMSIWDKTPNNSYYKAMVFLEEIKDGE